MVGLVDYGSGSESDSDAHGIGKLLKADPKAAISQPKRPTKKKFAISLPALQNGDDDAEDSIDDRPTKKPRVGSGKSSLLGLLPAPKQTIPIAAAKERVLGGGSGPGLVFSSSKDTPLVQEPFSNPYITTTTSSSEAEALLVPPSVQKGKPNVSLEETYSNPPKPNLLPPTSAVDFFSLGRAISAAPNTPSLSSSIPALSSAPALPDFKVPEPTPHDLYLGYYQLSSGVWVAHDPAYFAKFSKKWQDDYDAHVRALEKGAVKGFEDYDDTKAQEIDPVEQMERAKREVQEREARKALTKGAGSGPAEPKMKLTAAKLNGVARSRHQLATMLKEAYENRESLEEKIAEGRRNRKEAGNKYGF